MSDFTASKNREVSQEEKDRTKRQKLIQDWDQSILKNATVFIAGVGGSGCEIARDLTLMGVGKLILCDMDKIETFQLFLVRCYSIKAMKENLKSKSRRTITINESRFRNRSVHDSFRQKGPMEKYQECDVVVMALDNVQARMDLNKFCLKLGIPCIEGGTVGFEG